jgi:hypothetical protein
MTQEENDLVDPQDDIDLEEQRKKSQASKENTEDDTESQDEVYDSDAETVDPREEAGVSREQEEEAIISKEKQLEKQKTKKKAKE